MALSQLSLIEELQALVVNKLILFGIDQNSADFLYGLFAFLALLVVCWVINLILQNSMVKIIEKIITKTKTEYDDYLVQHKLFGRLAHFVPAMLVLRLGPVVLQFSENMVLLVIALGQIYMVITIVRSLSAVLNALHDVYNHRGYSENRPIKGYVQMAHVVVYFIAALTIVAIVFNVSLLAVFTGLGAIAAVLLLVFKDTILGITASIQLSANDMVKVGDWITMPSSNVDGDVIEITLYAVKVQNFDKTISTIPPYDLISKSFTNWKGMTNAGGRRIKRSISIDMKSIQFCTDEMLDRYRKIHLLRDYIDERQDEIADFNKQLDWDLTVSVNGRRLTNLGVFRKYLDTYLRQHPSTHKEMTMMVRQLQPTDAGIPIEIYAFTSSPQWIAYENAQSDIFDHILAIIPQFDLRVFQTPTGDDLKYIALNK